MAFYNGCAHTGKPEVTQVWHDGCFLPVYGAQFDRDGFQPDPWRWTPIWADEHTVAQHGPTPCGGCGRPVVGREPTSELLKRHVPQLAVVP